MTNSLHPSNDDLLSHIQGDKLTEMFVSLGWERPNDWQRPAATRQIAIENNDLSVGIAVPVAKKATVAIYKITLDETAKEDFTPARIKSIANGELSKQSTERIMIITDPSGEMQEWVWAEKKRPGGFTKSTHEHKLGSQDNELCRKLKEIFLSPDEQDIRTHELIEKVRKNFDTTKVTASFYKEFVNLRKTLEGKVSGIACSYEKYWYSILILNRLMFIWFLQKRGFLNNGDQNYLENCLAKLRQLKRRQNFYNFYKNLLLPLFHDYLGRGKILESDPEIAAIIGEIPYINGGIFAVHQLEQKHEIDIPDEAFDEIFKVFNKYTWHMGDLEGKDPREINPDILGYICEQHVNQKGTGAYYTKEDITQYMCSRTIAPLLIDRICNKVPDSSSEVWQILQSSPRQYIPTSLFYGENEAEAQSDFATWDGGRKSWSGKVAELRDEDLPGYPDPKSKAELLEVMDILGEDTLPGYLDPWLSQKASDCRYRLPGETNREALERIQWAQQLEDRIQAGEVSDTNECITLNLEITQLLIDWIASTKSEAVVKAAWDELRQLRVLDPTAGSGAFLRAALHILEDLYEAVRSASVEIANMEPPPPQSSYLTRRTIIVNNLYANEINQEATEICQLRMFLALASCIEDLSAIEPLPDLDLNIRSGNLLVGAESFENANELWGSNLASQNYLEPLKQQHQQSIQLHKQFIEAQDNSQIELSLQIKQQIFELENQQRQTLDTIALAENLGQDPSDEKLTKWRASHSPFHWFVEFPEAMQNGGFDVIIGNPPFVSKKIATEGTEDIQAYTYSGFKTDNCPDIYAPCLERSARLLKPDGRFGMIAPISLSSGLKFKAAREVLDKLITTKWVMGFDREPSALFNARVRPIILIGVKGTKKLLYTTNFRRFNNKFRINLFDATRYSKAFIANKLSGIWVLSGNMNINKFIEYLENLGKNIGSYIDKDGNYYVGFRRIGNSKYLSAFKIDPPSWEDTCNGPGERIKANSDWLIFSELFQSDIIFLFLAGRIGHILWTTVSDGFHVTTSVVKWKPISIDDLNVAQEKIKAISKILTASQIRSFKVDKNNGYIGNFDLKKCRHISDFCDKLILEELNFLNLQPHILLASDLLIKSSDNTTTIVSSEEPKDWTPTYGPWEEGMPEQPA